ncbi:MAG: zinc-dependent alcohol dehydrogenase family protein [Gammaproteobacteria bacterium]
MRGMVIEKPGAELQLRELPIPSPIGAEVLVKVRACAVCRTDLHVLDGELPQIAYPVIPGHQVVGEVVAGGPDAVRQADTSVGISWLGSSCGSCRYCEHAQENLCDAASFNGYTVNGGYAEYMLADSRYCFELQHGQAAIQTAPLLCGGLIGYRSLCKADDAQRIGIYGYGSAAHLVTQLAKHQGREIYAFTRPGDEAAQQFAMQTGAVWAGNSDDIAPELLDAAIIFAPVGDLVPKALRDIRKGGVVVCGGIHMSDIPAFPYKDLWGERRVCSVANLTRRDGEEFLALVKAAKVHAETTSYPFEKAPQALEDLRCGRLKGTAVLIMN